MFPTISLELIIATTGYIGIFILMTLNGLISFPSSQLLYIIVGYFVGTKNISFVIAAFIGAFGNAVGNIVLYELTRRRGISILKKILFIPISEKTLLNLESTFKKRGRIFLFFGKLIPAIKVFVPIIAGISRTPRIIFAIIMFIASFIWSLIFLSIGFIFGKGSGNFGISPLIMIPVALLFFLLFICFLKREGINFTEFK